MDFKDVAWGWYQQEYKYHLLRAQKALLALFGSAAKEPLAKIEALLEKPNEGMRLTSDLQTVARQLETHEGTLPMRGIPIVEVVSVSEAMGLLKNRCGQEASLRYRAAISRTLTTPELCAKYPALEASIRELLRALTAFRHQTLKTQLPAPLLSIVLSNEQLYMLCYFWFVCNYRFHPIIAGIEHVRSMGGYVLWFNHAGNATLLMDEPEIEPDEEKPFTLDLDAFVENDDPPKT